MSSLNQRKNWLYRKNTFHRGQFHKLMKMANGRSIRRKYLRNQTNSLIVSLGSRTQIYKLLNTHQSHLDNSNITVQVPELLYFAVMVGHMLKLFSLWCIILLKAVLGNRIHSKMDVTWQIWRSLGCLHS